MHYVVGGTVITYIGTNLLNSLIVGTVDTLYSGVVFIKNGNESNKAICNIKKEIEKLDIKIKLELVKTLMDNLPVNDITKIIENGLVELMYKIKTIIDAIEFDISKHNDKWFPSYRSINFNDKLDELKTLMFILDGRINLLMNIGKGN